MTFVQLTPEEFEQHAHTSDQRYFEQTPEFGKLLSQRHYKVIYLGWKENDTITISTLAWLTPMAGGYQLKIHYGPVCTHPASLKPFLIALTHYAKANHIIELECNPYDIHQTFDDQGKPISEANDDLITLYESAGFHFGGLTRGFPAADWHYVKPLKNITTPQELLKSLNKNSQRLIKQAQELGIQVRPLALHELSIFEQLLLETGERQGFMGKDLDYLKTFYQTFGERAEFLVAELDLEVAIAKTKDSIERLSQETKAPASQLTKLGKQLDLLNRYAADKTVPGPLPLTCALVTYLPQEAVYFIGGSSKAYHKLSAPFMLQYTAMCRTMDRGIPSYNFLGITGHFDGSDGVLRFKQNFNGYIERRPGTFYYYPRPLKYKLIQLVKKVLRR